MNILVGRSWTIQNNRRILLDERERVYTIYSIKMIGDSK